MITRRLVALFVAVAGLAGAAFAGALVSGPMLGYRAHREVFLWVETKDASKVTLAYWRAGQPETTRTMEQAAPSPTPAGGQILHFRPGLLEPGAAYEYRLAIDGVAQTLPHPATFQTQPLWEWRAPAPDFKFITGSCAYINDPAYDRPGTPYGRTVRTFELMGESDAEFVVWLGDNWYYREADFDSISGLWYRAQHDRAAPELSRLFATKHHYATWDDHDYGPNDSNSSYEYKDEALKIFQAYWGNHSYGERDNPGVYTKFYWSDAAFFLMDNHYHRDAATLNQDLHPEKRQWGRRQLEWLKQSLIAAKELRHFKFLFIATGNQMLQVRQSEESHQEYRREREELLQFIREQEITGVIFLTGDVHHSGLYRRQLAKGGPWVYEVTSSPLSSGSWKVEESYKATDPYLVKDTLVGDQNFVTVEVRGPKDAREAVFTCIDKQGAVRFTHTVPLSDLQ
jgi:alkaline phosphatase D